ncbi:MAG: hypothetical protein WC980_07870 [Candidatus Brocadiia bacterium]
MKKPNAVPSKGNMWISGCIIRGISKGSWFSRKMNLYIAFLYQFQTQFLTLIFETFPCRILMKNKVLKKSGFIEHDPQINIKFMRMKNYYGKFFEIPHVVLLGAGASKASFPKGDKNGKILPLMKDIITTIGLSDLLKELPITDEEYNDFELLYSNLSKRASNKELMRKIEERIYNYFSDLEIPYEATIYDKLILSLREKDIIATFNWDPLLLLAYRRCGELLEKTFALKPPVLSFLHGNVGIGICRKHKKAGLIQKGCKECEKAFEPVPLLYPIICKNYSDNPFIKDEWIRLQHYLENTYFLTIFGYGAPTTDIDAMSLMHEGWKKNPRIELVEVEIIDVKDESKLKENWDKFIISHHYRTLKIFERSYIYRHPRRSIEAFFDCFMQCEPWRENPLPKTNDLNELIDWLHPLFEQEANNNFIPNWNIEN